jgi:hypothetical protein
MQLAARSRIAAIALTTAGVAVVASLAWNGLEDERTRAHVPTQACDSCLAHPRSRLRARPKRRAR